MDADLMMHTVEVLCFCDEDPCRMERYVADVRIAEFENAELREVLRQVNQSASRGLQKGALPYGFVVG